MDTNFLLPAPLQRLAMKVSMAMSLMAWQAVSVATPAAQEATAHANVPVTNQVGFFEVIIAIGCGALIAWLLMYLFNSTEEDNASPHNQDGPDSGNHG